MHGHQQKLQRMMMKFGKVIMTLLQDPSQAIVKMTLEVKAIPKKRLMLSQRQCTQEITGREKKKKKGSSKIKKTTSQSNRFCRGYTCHVEH
jgi:hypothetical protein